MYMIKLKGLNVTSTRIFPKIFILGKCFREKKRLSLYFSFRKACWEIYRNLTLKDPSPSRKVGKKLLGALFKH